ncbi:MAG: hypothetical protein ACI8Q1_003032 [Parvicella sp.]|jgi:hypothetical protein
MIQKKIKYRVINDWSGIIGAIGFLSILFAGFALSNQDWTTGIGAIILSLGILSKAVETIIDLENKTITQYSSVFLFVKLKDLKEHDAAHFDTVRLYMHSEVLKHRSISRMSVGTSRVREYNVDLYAPNTKNVFSVAVFTDYKEARKLLYLFAKMWKYIPEDEIALKMSRNKQEQNERLKSRRR